MKRMQKKKRILLTGLALSIAVLHLVPFYILLTTALKQKGDFSSKWKLPEEFSIANFTEAWDKAGLTNSFINTAIITFVSALLLIFIGSLAAYPLARRRTKLNQAVYFLFIAIMIIPPLSSMVPLYKMVVELGMMNTHAVAILNNTAAYMPLAIFLYAGFIRSTIPKELEEAARMDGAGTMGIFFNIVFPLLKPVTATVCIIACVFIWNDYQFSIFFLQDKEVQTLTVAIAGFFGQNANNLHLVAAASLMAMLPMTILFLFLQKYFIKGLSSGALKG
ncbi:maltose ABC transporter permease [Bacillus glycinifermentans]|uniref:Carbohydrate ABC transporter permease n=2 Tax=Bacillaceae TaxID=186817 RepID=A0A0J6HFK4_9BACI|nr:MULTISPECIES: carbohydrate ABC transporter permease [Bacillus]ATH94983.1 carbohydrate ABC transporter permease [Bacillus glycinifermentans]KKB73435.1 maltose ABC transporter permease [Bacillus sp. TH008]KMM57917.1 maltose ABC transporter permease [Bacillus glycinifermentans]KRT93173.1 maltose ABC transporter permease [Bacillus glycinifermentans]MBU8789072.1 carbohydrate ABC transporter permease [Bacillus glycinifermentans]